MLAQPRVRKSEIVPAPVEDVWEAIREFDSIDQWHPVITDCTIEDGMGSTEIGGVRNFSAGEKSLREQLVAHSDVDRYYQYTILEGAGGKTDYLSELRAVPVTESNETLVIWEGAFDAAPEDMEAEQDGLTKVYTAGLSHLRDQFE